MAGPHHAEVVAEVRAAGGFDAGKNARHGGRHGGGVVHEKRGAVERVGVELWRVAGSILIFFILIFIPMPYGLMKMRMKKKRMSPSYPPATRPSAPTVKMSG